MTSALTSARRVAPKGLSVSVLFVVAFTLPLVAARAWSLSLADRWASALAAELAELVWKDPAGGEAPKDSLSEPEPEPDVEAAAGDAPPAQRAARAFEPTRQASHARGSLAPHGVRISSAQVLALAARRAMPQAVPVRANAQHPAGLLLHGVSGWGIGLQDGDVLTEAAGQRASSVAVVVGIVLAARGRQVPEISGRFYRTGTPFALTVEQPYPKAPLPG